MYAFGCNDRSFINSVLHPREPTLVSFPEFPHARAEMCNDMSSNPIFIFPLPRCTKEYIAAVISLFTENLREVERIASVLQGTFQLDTLKYLVVCCSDIKLDFAIELGEECCLPVFYEVTSVVKEEETG